MTNVLYVPLDERACNYAFPQQLCAMAAGIEMLTPPRELLGCLKAPADNERLWAWLAEKAPRCAYAILSVDTLVYGNIINSRTHHLSAEVCMERLARFRELKRRNPGLKIHAFNLVARVAAYDDAHEDPDYWAFYGRSIWRYAYLTDKLSRGCGEAGEQEELAALGESIPAEVLADFLARREVDRAVNLACVDLVRDNIFEILTIPKDDTAEFGYAAMDQSAIAKRVREERLSPRVLVYPGADEVGSVLFARVFCLIKRFTPRVYVRYSSVLGPTIVPRYEDRPLQESVKWQITSLGGLLEDNPDAADCMLALNTPGTHQIECAYQDDKDLTFSSHSNMLEFLRYVNDFCQTRKKAVGLAEVSVCNGCENEFMDCACQLGTLHSVQAVGGWNTAQNTIGVVLAQTVIAAYYDRFAKRAEQLRRSEEFKLRSIACDWFFQANALRSFLAQNEAAETRIDPFRLGGGYDAVRQFIMEQLRRQFLEKFGSSYKGAAIVLDDLYFSWDGVFYIGASVKLEGFLGN